MKTESGRCEGCGEFSVLMPIHGDRGGPLRCPLCLGQWNAEHGCKRRLGRIVIRALRAYDNAGGSWSDFNNLKMTATFSSLGMFGDPVIIDPLGYLAEQAKLDSGEIVELTSELLTDTLK